MNPETLASLFSSFPPWLAVVLMAMLPVAELRLAIPVAILVLKLDPLYAFILAVTGNMIPVIPLLLFLGPVSDFLRRWRIWDVFFTWLFRRTHHNHSERFERYGTIALSIFVGVPLPVTGAWTGCAAAFVFGITFRNAFAAISFGVLLSGIVVTLLTVTGVNILNNI